MNLRQMSAQATASAANTETLISWLQGIDSDSLPNREERREAYARELRSRLSNLRFELSCPADYDRESRMSMRAECFRITLALDAV